MTQSSEYPDLLWMPPRAWGSGRDGKAVRYIVVHYTAGSERSTSAEDGAAYDQRRTDGTSTHYFVDSNSIVQCVLTKDRANAARHKGNRLGIQYELCGTVQTRAQWLDAASLPTIKNAAHQMARDCLKYNIPVRRLSAAEVRGDWYNFPTGPKGIVGHVDVTNAYPEDGGDHTDPGAQFPWDVLLSEVEKAVARAVVAISGNIIELFYGDVDPVDGWYYVNRLQKMLPAAYGVTVDGIYGTQTMAAVKKYSTEYLNRSVDGKKVDVLTWKRLYGIRN